LKWKRINNKIKNIQLKYKIKSTVNRLKKMEKIQKMAKNFWVHFKFLKVIKDKITEYKIHKMDLSEKNHKSQRSKVKIYKYRINKHKKSQT
jgi:hypothetical protein